MGPLILLTVLLVAVSAQSDLESMIWTPEMVGEDVVQATVSNIETACIFPPNQLYHRRLAFVESADGFDPIAWLPDYHGGIWRVDEAMFLATQTEEAWEANRRYITRSERRWGIQWMNATWEDLRIPMYSAMGALMYTYLNDQADPDMPPWGIEDQADYWIANYRHDGNREEYISDSELLEPYCNDKIDLVFTVDESSSIGSLNVPLVKQFMIDVVNSLEIGMDATRVGILKFGQIFDLPDTEVVQFLNETTNAEDLINVINFMRIDGGDTPSDRGLEDTREIMFSEEAGARPIEEVVRRNTIFFSDGVSNNPDETIRQAKLNRRAGLNTYVVAVYGHDETDWEELEAIASPPRCKNVNSVEEFEGLEHIRDALVRQVCDSPLVITEGCWNLDLPRGLQSCLVVVGDNGTTLQMTPDGSNVAFLESSVTYPDMIDNEGNIRIEEDTTEYYTIEPLPEDQTIEGSRDFMYCGFLSEEVNVMDICVEVEDIDCCVPNFCTDRGDEGAGCTNFGLGECECTCSRYTGEFCENYAPGNGGDEELSMPSTGHWKEVWKWECAPGWVGNKCDIPAKMESRM